MARLKIKRSDKPSLKIPSRSKFASIDLNRINTILIIVQRSDTLPFCRIFFKDKPQIQVTSWLVAVFPETFSVKVCSHKIINIVPMMIVTLTGRMGLESLSLKFYSPIQNNFGLNFGDGLKFRYVWTNVNPTLVCYATVLRFRTTENVSLLVDINTAIFPTKFPDFISKRFFTTNLPLSFLSSLSSIFTLWRVRLLQPSERLIKS